MAERRLDGWLEGLHKELEKSSLIKRRAALHWPGGATAEPRGKAGPSGGGDLPKDGYADMLITANKI